MRDHTEELMAEPEVAAWTPESSYAAGERIAQLNERIRDLEAENDRLKRTIVGLLDDEATAGQRLEEVLDGCLVCLAAIQHADDMIDAHRGHGRRDLFAPPRSETP